MLIRFVSPCHGCRAATVPRALRRVLGRTVVFTAFAAFAAQAQAPLDVRVALVIGNSAYAAAPLVNPANDARAMADALRGMGFTVVELRDGRKAQIAEAISRVSASLLGKQGVGMFYYAGHGMQVDWHNYILPVDARLAGAADVQRETVDLSAVVDAFKAAGNRMNIVVLDACRDNPFSASASGKGLAQLDAPPGTFLAYATAPGNVAEDGDANSGNGLYTQYLLQEIKRPAAKIEDIFKRVRLQVRQKSQGRQIPWESTSLDEDFYFQPPKQAVKLSAQQEEELFEREITAWEAAKKANTEASYLGYLQQYPSGRFSEFAQSRLDRISAPRVTTQFRPDDALANDTLTERFRVGDTYVYQMHTTIPVVTDERKSWTVTGIEGDVVQMNGGGRTFDRLGNIQTRGGNRWEDAQFFPAEYQVGKRWQLRARIETNKRDEAVALDARIKARERITVAAGTFDTFRIEITGSTDEGRRFYWIYWMNPKYGMPIKWTEQRSNARSRLGREETAELVGLKAQR